MLRTTCIALLTALAPGAQLNALDSASMNVQPAAGGSGSSFFTSNPVCVQKQCTNPMTPGLMDMPRLESVIWQCTKPTDVRQHLQFCKSAINYDPAVPTGTNSSVALDKIVASQDGAASTMFFYHLSALGYEAWDYQRPNETAEPCVRRVYELTCFTYFPKNQGGCSAGDQVPYIRPCRDTCEGYLKACEVQCCDESTQCVFQEKLDGGGVLSGYVDEDGPSALCTGTSPSGSSRLRVPIAMLLALFGLQVAGNAEVWSSRPSCASKCLLVALLVFCAASLQGCSISIASHQVPNWQKESDYLVQFDYVLPGQAASDAALNSCNAPLSSRAEVCSGHGECKIWSNQPLKVSNASVKVHGISFCECQTGWADPECRTPRKSQFKAFFLSIFAGFLGADRFYLGLMLTGTLKLLTLGGLGTWWLYDIVRVGSAPVYTETFKVAADLPHWLYVLIVLLVFGALGLLFSLDSYGRFRKKKRLEVMNIFNMEEARKLDHEKDESNYDGYGAVPPYSGAGVRLR